MPTLHFNTTRFHREIEEAFSEGWKLVWAIERGEHDERTIDNLSEVILSTRERLASALEAYGLQRAIDRLYAYKLDDVTECHDVYETRYSPDLVHLRRVFDALSPLIGSATGPNAEELLRSTLKNLACIVFESNRDPQCELDVHRVMIDKVKHVFDVCEKPQISGGIKNYVPDFGVRNLETAVELKFCKNETDVRTAIDGIYTDSVGYKDNNWKRFIAVFYCTQAFVAEEHIRQEWQAKQFCDAWEPIVVVGPGRTKPKRGASL